jgi:hypothetical protein
MTVDLSKLEVGDTVELRDGRRLIVEQIETLLTGTAYPYVLSINISKGTYTREGKYWTYKLSPLDIVAIYKKEKPMEQQATEVPAAQALAEGKLGWYRTREGGLAEVLTIIDFRIKFNSPVFGLLPAEQPASWTRTGYRTDCAPYDEDLITYLGTEKPKRKVMRTVEVMRWVNIYPQFTNAHDSLAMAINWEKARNPQPEKSDLIACVELRGSYEVEEEVPDDV